MTSTVQSLRLNELDKPEKSATPGPGTLARAVALHLSGKREEALEQLQRAAAGGQASAEIYRAMGHIEFELGRFEASAKSYRALLRLKPQFAMGWLNLAVCLERSSAWDQAAEAFHKASTLDAANLEAHMGLALCYLRLEDPQSALRGFEHCLELAPDHADGLFGKAAALQSLGQLEEAAKLYDLILQRDPESEEPLSNLVLIGMQKQDFDMVREYSERLLDLKPDSTVALEGLAAWASAAGDHALTAKFCNLLVSAVPGHFEA
jgi:tetratricopeptide (TPR) repeat protein